MRYKDIQKGITLVEMLIVIAILAILSAIAVPSFNDFIKTQRMRAMATDLQLSLVRARSEAIKRNTNVTISPNTAGSWQSGWTIPDPNNAGSNIEEHSSYKLLTVTGPASVVYQGSGRVAGTTLPAFDIGATGSATHKCVTADLSGRPYVKATAC
jgi:type IV fimbrial biogenesis protein FimT